MFIPQNSQRFLLMDIDTDRQSGFLNTLLAGERSLASNMVVDLLREGASVDDIYEQLLKSSLYKIGVLWETGRIGVATEHLASAIVQAIMNDLYPTIAATRKQPKTVVLACVENEQHQVGIKMVSDVFELAGWNTHFLGAGLPTDDLVRFMNSVRPQVLALSMALSFNWPTLVKMLQAIRRTFPTLPILVGGQAFGKGGQERLLTFSNVTYLSDLYSLKALLASPASLINANAH